MAALGLEWLIGVFNWPGLGTRYKAFFEWCKTELEEAHGDNDNDGHDDASLPPSSLVDPATALRGFGRFLGRVTTYRALSLSHEALESITKKDCIFPSGQLHVGEEALARDADAAGARTVAVARLFMKHMPRLVGAHDPSISLHDDWQTTTLIASYYASYDRCVCAAPLPLAPAAVYNRKYTATVLVPLSKCNQPH